MIPCRWSEWRLSKAAILPALQSNWWSLLERILRCGAFCNVEAGSITCATK